MSVPARLPTVAAVLLLAAAAQAQSAADAPTAAVVGVACVDVDEDGACGARDLPLADTPVRTAGGLATRTDAAGRFHVAALGAERTTGLGDALLPRPKSATLFLDVERLGPDARAPAPATVALAPGVIAPVVLAARLPARVDAPAPRLAGSPTVRIDGSAWFVELPLALAPGHALAADGAPVVVDAAGAARVPVAIADREAVLTLLDSAPDGRVTLARLRVLRVPRREGGDLVVTAPLEVLARVDVPPRARATAPGPLLVPVHAAPGVVVELGDAHAVVGAGGVAWLWTRAAESLDVRVREGEVTLTAALPLAVDPLAAMSARLAGELRAGAAGVTPFAQGRLDAQLRVPFDATTVAVGASVDDELAGAALTGRLRLQSAHTGYAPRLADAETDLAVWGDASTTMHDNPGGLALWANAQGPWGVAGLGVARTPLDEGEVGRFDRAVVGPFVDAAVELASVRVGVEAAGDATAAPFVDGAVVRKAHDILEGSGGRVSWLSHRDVVPGTERVAIELVDPQSGLVVERRVLRAGADYDVDRASGRLLLAAPLGLTTGVDGTRAAAFGFAWRSRLVVDYAYLPAAGEPVSHDGAARVFVQAGDHVAAGVSAAVAGSASEAATLLGTDVSARPLPWLALSASAAHSAGDPFAAADLARTPDAGLSYRAHVHDAAAGPLDGDAVALRARLGGDRSFAAVWGSYRAPGFVDGVDADPLGASRAGAEGRVELFNVLATDGLAAGTIVDARSGADPTNLAAGARLSSLDVGARLEGRLGAFRLALDGLHRRAERTLGEGVQVGEASAAGLELGVQLATDVEVFGGHLQRVAGGGEGPGAVDPTLSYLGARLPLGERAHLEGRVGIHPDLRPEAAITADVNEGDGRTRYGTVAAASDAPWGGRGTTLVSGARERLGADAEVYVEDRLARAGELSTAPWRGARVVGARVRPGPLFAGVSVESEVAQAEQPVGWRGAIAADAGVALPSAMVSAFTEIGADDAVGAPALRRYALGAQAQARPLDDVTIGARALLARGAPLDGAPERPFAELFVGGAWRPAALPDVFAHYALREDRRVDLLVERLHLARLALGLGELPGAQLLLAAQGAQHELAERASSLGVTQALLGTARITTPIWLVEPALELGARGVFGAGLDAQLAGSARVEAALRVGPAAVGVGVVVVGYTGTGLEPITLDPAAPPIYLVVRGALP
ncbi:MAG: hypothetical protein HYS27_11150 [Deltaproteobacteria bacterium]|nr:hypothetical protein [Deltaproteobacteria bacterium]